MIKKLKNKQVSVVNIHFGKPMSLEWDFSVLISFRYKGKDENGRENTEITMKKDITNVYVKYFGKITSERAKKALLKTMPTNGFLAECIYPETEMLCYGQGRRNYLISFNKGTFDPWLKKAADSLFA